MLLAVRVSVLVEVAGFGLNAAVTPLCIPDAAKFTLPLKPLCGVIVIVLFPLAPPGVRTTEAGEAERVKFPTDTVSTVRLIVVVFISVPDVPVTVTVTVPVAAVLPAVRVSVLEEVAGFGVNAAVTPVGKPDADRVTLPLKPFCGVIAIVVVIPLPPCVIVRLPGEGERVKLGLEEEVGQAFTRLKALTVPMPVAKSQPVVVPYAIL